MNLVKRKPKEAQKDAGDRYEYLYSHFGGVNENGRVLGTIDTIERGLNPFHELPPRAKRLIRNQLTDEEFRLVMTTIPPELESQITENIQIFLSVTMRDFVQRKPYRRARKD